MLTALAGALLAVLTLGAPEASAQPAGIPGETYSGTIETAAGCGGGVISISVGESGSDISSVAVASVGTGSAAVSGSARFDADSVPIAGGTFSTYFDAQGIEVTVGGSFDTTESIGGTVTLTPSTCGPLSFAAIAGAEVTPPASEDAASDDDDSGLGAAAQWGIIAAVAVALVALGGGVWYLRSRG